MAELSYGNSYGSSHEVKHKEATIGEVKTTKLHSYREIGLNNLVYASGECSIGIQRK